MTNIDFFNDLAQKTSKHLNGGRMFFHIFVEKKIVRDVHEKLTISSKDILLDLGGGCGNITKYLLEKCHQVCLADMAEQTISVAKKKLSKFSNVVYKIVDINQDLPFKDSEFDKIVCYSVVHYLDKKEYIEGLILELIRITNSDGKILIGDIPLKEKHASLLKEREKKTIKNFFLNQKYFFDKRLLRYIYTKKGINISQVKGVNYTQIFLENILKDIPNIKFYF
ncbi:methyltransferase domain-containing protein, partial [Patescibacteria group bacterium]|nr:methyltransferase domain-containing protein [Patescibacteria group bacterium]